MHADEPVAQGGRQIFHPQGRAIILILQGHKRFAQGIKQPLLERGEFVSVFQEGGFVAGQHRLAQGLDGILQC